MQRAKIKITNKNLKILILLFSLFTIHFSLFTASYAEHPNRIVSLAPSITEILFAAGLGDRVVGVTNFCDYPDEAREKPKIGGMSNPSLEAIIRLKPDMVIVTPDGNPLEIYQRLKDAHIKTVVFKARRIDEIGEEIRKLGDTLNEKERFYALASKIEEGISYYKSHPPLNHKEKVLFVIWPEPLIVAGRGTVISDAINILGGVNIGDTTGTMYPRYSLEEVIRQSPDIIFIGKGHERMKELSESFLKRVAMVPAVKNKRVYYLGDAIYRLGPRIGDGLKEMVEAIERSKNEKEKPSRMR